MTQRQQERPSPPQGKDSQWPPPKQVLQRILTEDEYAQELIQVAQDAGHRLAKRLRAAQVRKFYGEVRRLALEAQHRTDPADRAKVFRELALLRPKLAYQSQRVGDGGRELRDLLDPAIELVNTDADRLRRLAELFEAVLAYHKFHGGQD